MSKELQLKVSAITGAGSGIGKAIAKAFAQVGSRVAVTDVNWEWANSVANEIKEAGGEAIALKLDVTRQDECQAVVDLIVERWGHIDLWVNNAGVSTMNRFVDLTERDWDFNMDINAKGTFLCSQVVVRQMLKQTPDAANGLRGKIINIASMAGKRGNAPFLAHYVASKFAVVGLTQAMAGELAKQGITVNAICPGYVATSMQEREVEWEAKLRGVKPQEVRQLYIDDTPLGRLETAEDVAKVALFLASPLADFITGESINVNGGSFME
ncbi:MAG: 3-ketoacyl-ACP reductase [Anaerolineae bacterium]|nr:MAG: 3-ketoacyl-ACP reductase [Anaerolineae bacterium]